MKNQTPPMPNLEGGVDTYTHLETKIRTSMAKGIQI